jgi:GTP-binding protein LepA
MYIEIQEPIAKVELITPKEFIGNVIELAQDHRGMMKNQQFLDQNRAVIHYEIPMAELVGDFYDDLKSVTS